MAGEGIRRIVVVTSFPWPQNAGLERVVETEVRELARRGFDVHVVCSRSATDPTERLAGVAVTVHRRPYRYLPFLPGFVFGLYFVFSAAWTLRRLAARPDAVVHAHNTLAWLSAWLAGLGRKSALHLHSISSQDNLAMESGYVPWPVRVMHWLDDRFNLVVEHLVYNLAPVVMGVSEREWRDARSKMRRPERACVVRNGIDTALFRPDPGARAAFRKRHGIARDEVVVLFLGRFNPKNGTMVIARAVPLANRLGAASARFVFVGEGTEEPAMREVLAGETNVVFAPAQASYPVYPAADVFVSHVTSILEGYGLTVLEGMAAGCATVSGDDAIKREVLDDALVLVPKDDPAALAEAFAGLVADVPRREALGRRARARIEEVLSVGAQVDQILRHLGALPR